VKYIDEFRDPDRAYKLAEHIRAVSKKPLRIMQFCGGHVHAIMRYGIGQMLPPMVQLLSGPGCPVCVTSNRDLDYAVALARQPGVIVATFGDMVRVPGSRSSLQEAKAGGADVRIVYSTLDALRIAREHPDKQVVFLGVGFETTAPTVAASILQASAENLGNYAVFSVLKTTPAATEAVLAAGEVSLSGVLGPGHVSTIIGSRAWEFLARDHGIPCVIAGFEPLDILRAICRLVEMGEEGRAEVGNAYGRSVTEEGNRVAQEMLERVFCPADAEWRGFGFVPGSGMHLRPEYVRYDARANYDVDPGPTLEHGGCRCGEVLRGTLVPPECPLFRRACTPAHPVGPCMVSSEGACAAFMMYGEAS
jgi:hydrogenase expression/formation protein HypD